MLRRASGKEQVWTTLLGPVTSYCQASWPWQDETPAFLGYVRGLGPQAGGSAGVEARISRADSPLPAPRTVRGPSRGGKQESGQVHRSFQRQPRRRGNQCREERRNSQQRWNHAHRKQRSDGQGRGNEKGNIRGSPAPPRPEMALKWGDSLILIPSSVGVLSTARQLFSYPQKPPLSPASIHTDTCMKTRVYTYTFTPLSLTQETTHFTSDSAPSPRGSALLLPQGLSGALAPRVPHEQGEETTC